MEKLFDKFQTKLGNTDTTFVRDAIGLLAENARLIGLKGQRGVGKSTLLLQYAKTNKIPHDKQLYVSVDDLWFSEHNLVDLAETFHKRGGELLLFDEIHKYSNWSQELKNIYDDFPKLKVVFTGSSMLQIINAKADISRRAVVFPLQGLSFREFLAMKYQKVFEKVTLEELLNNHLTISKDILSEIKPLQYFHEYLAQGYFPFFNESEHLFSHKLNEIINMVLEVEMPLLRGMNVLYVNKLKQVLWVLAESVPFVPNMNKLSERIGINRKTLLLYVQYLADAGILKHIYKNARGITVLTKPNKILLDNTNLAHTLSSTVNIGTIRETFFVNQVSKDHLVEYANKGDFSVDRKFTFEIGGKNKDGKQIKQVKNSFIVADDIEYGFQSKIPLWLFGFLY